MNTRCRFFQGVLFLASRAHSQASITLSPDGVELDADLCELLMFLSASSYNLNPLTIFRLKDTEPLF
jgi:hypothetical protein